MITIEEVDFKNKEVIEWIVYNSFSNLSFKVVIWKILIFDCNNYFVYIVILLQRIFSFKLKVSHHLSYNGSQSDLFEELEEKHRRKSRLNYSIILLFGAVEK